MPYTFVERQKIHRKAKKILGIKPKQDGNDRYIFMQECISDMMDSGESDSPSDARDVCELLWSEIEDIYAEDY